MSRTIKRSLKVMLTDAELLKLGTLNAQYQADLQKNDLEAKEVAADFKAKKATIETNIQRTTGLINNRYEFRPVECRVDLNVPERGKKRIIRLDTHEIVGEELMDAGDEQMPLLGEQPDHE